MNYMVLADLGDVDENNHFTSLGKVLDQLSLRQCKRWSQRTRIHRFHQRPQLTDFINVPNLQLTVFEVVYGYQSCSYSRRCD